MSTELEDLLAREQGLGTYDSTGVFTLSVAEARRKLSQFQLGSLEMAVLKLIQALVQLEPEAIWIESDERSFSLNWAESSELLEPDQFARNLEQVMLGAPGPAKDLAIGLAGFLDREPAEVWWAHWESLKPVEIVGLLTSRGQAQMRPPVGLFRRVHCLRVEADSLALDRSTIAQRILFCPISILWNGRLICDLSWNPPGYHSSQPPYWADFYFASGGPVKRGLALKPIGPCKTLAQWFDPSQRRNFAESNRGVVALRRYIFGESARPLRFTGRRPSGLGWTESLGSSNEVSLETCLGESIWVISGVAYATSALLCVKHGVLLNPCRMPLRLGGMISVLATPDLDVDLGQFSPLLNSRSWAEVLELLDKHYRQVLENLDRQSSLIFRENKEFVPMVAGAGILGSLAGGAVAPVYPLGLLLGGAVGAFLCSKYLEHQHELRLSFLKGVTRK